MYYIKKSEWKKLEKEHPDYCGTSIKNPCVHTIFEGLVPGNNGKGGTTLLFEHQHFEIVDDDYTMESAEGITIDELWGMACSGEIDKLKEYYDNGGKKNRRYYRFGKYHSLIAGAWRNGNYETVKYLVSIGESLEDNERSEVDIKSLYMENIIKAAESVVDYFTRHNKNLTKTQDYLIDDLQEALRVIRSYTD